MIGDRVPQILQLAIDPVCTERRLKGKRVEEQVNVFRKPIDKAPPLGQAGAALKITLSPATFAMTRSASVT
jgi:hypothetical protein